MTRADDYGQADDQVWIAAWADTARRPYMISGSGLALHSRRDCVASVEIGGAVPGGPWPTIERTPRPVFLTAAEATAFLAESTRHHHCGTCARIPQARILQARTTTRRTRCGLGWPR
jgi:hypothetical protein